jgi:metal-responsive CopG/Arc/MetJ family transcriptional regulator
MRVFSVKLPEELNNVLSEISRRRKASRSTIVREALESFARGSKRSITTAAGDLVGSLRGPTDLATHTKHLSGYGE